MANAGRDHLLVPFKEAFGGVELDDNGEPTPSSLSRFLSQDADDWRTVERWATEVIASTEPSKCNLFVPFKELRDLSLASASQTFDRYKELERWAKSWYDCDCGCPGGPGTGPQPAYCLLFIPYKDCYIQWKQGVISLATAQAQDFDNWKAIERWAFLHTSGDCCVIYGGTVSDSGGYRYHTFDTAGTHDLVLCKGKTYEYLVVGGGGGTVTARQASGGGGGGGVLTGTLTAEGFYTVTVGAGGDETNSPTSLFGGDSSIGSLVVATGGGRGPIQNGGAGGNGGSGGGGNSGVNSGNPGGAGGTGTVGQGNNGGAGNTGSSSTSLRAGGGGGGATAAGGNAASGVAGNGGAGQEWPTGSGNFYGGGGGGGRRGGAGGTGGTGGGGNGSAGDGLNPQNGTPGTGGGGGGVGFGGNGALGGHGIVIIRYLL